MTNTPSPKAASPLLTMTGLEQLRAMLAGRFPPPSIATTIGFALLEVEEGRAVFEGAPHKGVLNPMGAVHGGWYGTLLDSAMGCAVHSRLAAGQGYTTLEYKVNLIRGATDRETPLRAVGNVSHFGRRTAVATGKILGDDGKIYAEGSTTCLVFDL